MSVRRGPLCENSQWNRLARQVKLDGIIRMRLSTGLFVCFVLVASTAGAPVHDALDDDGSQLTKESPGQHNNVDTDPVWESPIDELLSRARSPADNNPSVVAQLQQMYKELAHLQPAAATRKPGLNKTADIDVEQASLAAVELDSVEGFQAASDAGFMLAVLASTGIAASDVPLNDTWAVQTLHVCARAGSEEARLALAHRYYLGYGVPKSCHEGVRRARSIADEYVILTEGTNSPDVPLEPVSLRMRHRHGSYDDSSTQDTWNQLQLQADMYNLGDTYQRLTGYRELLGQDMEANPVQAMRHFEAAAAQGDGFAEFNLGYMHMKGMGTSSNATAAEQHFKQAASQGIGSAYNGLGVLYFSGQTEKGVDYAAAKQAFENGVALGDSDSMFNLATLYAGGHGVERNDSLAYDYYLEAHDMGHWRAPYALAVSHQAGLGVPANCSTAWHYFQIFIKERSSWTEQMELALLAVDAGNVWEGMMRYAVAGTQGSAIAQLNLAWLLQHDQAYDIPDRLHLSRRLLLQAAEGGLPEAWVDAGNLAFWNGSLGEAVKLYNMSAEAGESEGLYSMAWMHATASGIPRDISQAVRLYRQAVQYAPDWQHAAPPFLALLLLPSLLAVQWIQSIINKKNSSGAIIFVRLLSSGSWDTWVLTAAAIALTGIVWRRHHRSLQTQHARNRHDARDAGVG